MTKPVKITLVICGIILLVGVIALLATICNTSQQPLKDNQDTSVPSKIESSSPDTQPSATTTGEYGANSTAPTVQQPNIPPNTVAAKLVRVVDGDTIFVDIGGRQYKVRYIGMDTPETVHPFKPVQYFGKEASEKNRELLAGKEIRLEKDISETDKYGRLLRYVWVGNVMVNAELVRLGYASSYTYPPDVKYQRLFLQLEREARENNRGLWAAHTSN